MSKPQPSTSSDPESAAVDKKNVTYDNVNSSADESLNELEELNKKVKQRVFRKKSLRYLRSKVHKDAEVTVDNITYRNVSSKDVSSFDLNFSDIKDDIRKRVRLEKGAKFSLPELAHDRANVSAPDDFTYADIDLVLSTDSTETEIAQTRTKRANLPRKRKRFGVLDGKRPTASDESKSLRYFSDTFSDVSLDHDVKAVKERRLTAGLRQKMTRQVRDLVSDQIESVIGVKSVKEDLVSDEVVQGRRVTSSSLRRSPRHLIAPLAASKSLVSPIASSDKTLSDLRVLPSANKARKSLKFSGDVLQQVNEYHSYDVASPRPVSIATSPRNISSAISPHNISSAASPHNVSSAVSPHNIFSAASPRSVKGAASPRSVSGDASPHSISGAASPRSVSNAACSHRASSANSPRRLSGTASPRVSPTPSPSHVSPTALPPDDFNAPSPRAVSFTTSPSSVSYAASRRSTSSTASPLSVTGNASPLRVSNITSQQHVLSVTSPHASNAASPHRISDAASLVESAPLSPNSSAALPRRISSAGSPRLISSVASTYDASSAASSHLPIAAIRGVISNTSQNRLFGKSPNVVSLADGVSRTQLLSGDLDAQSVAYEQQTPKGKSDNLNDVTELGNEISVVSVNGDEKQDSFEDIVQTTSNLPSKMYLANFVRSKAALDMTALINNALSQPSTTKSSYSSNAADSTGNESENIMMPDLNLDDDDDNNVNTDDESDEEIPETPERQSSVARIYPLRGVATPVAVFGVKSFRASLPLADVVTNKETAAGQFAEDSLPQSIMEASDPPHGSSPTVEVTSVVDPSQKASPTGKSPIRKSALENPQMEKTMQSVAVSDASLLRAYSGADSSINRKSSNSHTIDLSRKTKQISLTDFLERITKPVVDPPIQELSSYQQAKQELLDMIRFQETTKQLGRKSIGSAVKTNPHKKKRDVEWKTLPYSYHRDTFNHFAKRKYGSKIIDIVSDVTEVFFDNLLSDLVKVAELKGRETIQGSDVVYLLRKQGIVEDTERSVEALIEEYLPIEEWPHNYAKK